MKAAYESSNPISVRWKCGFSFWPRVEALLAESNFGCCLKAGNLSNMCWKQRPESIKRLCENMRTTWLRTWSIWKIRFCVFNFISCTLQDHIEGIRISFLSCVLAWVREGAIWYNKKWYRFEHLLHTVILQDVLCFNLVARLWNLMQCRVYNG